jgi:hypothetical protein
MGVANIANSGCVPLARNTGSGTEVIGIQA